jgi:hypothetical protein
MSGISPDVIRRISLRSLAIIGLIGSAVACQVPVFRYALERWDPDRYQVVVLKDGALKPEQEALVRPMKDNDSPADVRIIDVKDTSNPGLQQLWRENHVAGAPLLITSYPASSPAAGSQTAAIAQLNEATVARLRNSPVRRELVQRLTAGHSAVWLFLESGNTEKDEQALQRLSEQLEADTDWLKLPSAEELEIEPEVLLQAKIPLRIQFSVISVQRDDPREQFLVDCLLNSESDLRSFDEPIAFPVFGRGRVLYALVGNGIAADTIREASAFITGPCSCQVKNQNPGFDLLLEGNWAAAVGATCISQPLPSDGGGPTLLTIPPGRSGR